MLGKHLLVIAAWFCLALAAGLNLSGCSSDKSTNSGNDGNSDDLDRGKYLIDVYVGNALLPEGGISASVIRLNKADASAMDCTITVNGTAVNMLPWPASTDSAAIYLRANFGYQAGTTYTVVATLAGSTATASFVAPAYVWPEITSPPDESGFTPAQSIPVAWTLDGATADGINLTVTSDGSDEPLYEQQLAGPVTSHTIPGSATAGWADYEEIFLMVDLGSKVWPFSGDLAAPGSIAGTVLPGTVITLPRRGTPGDPEWSIAVEPDRITMPADGGSKTRVWVHIQDTQGAVPDDGTQVFFSVQPAGSATIGPAENGAVTGETYTDLTAGTTPGAIQILASAVGQTASATITLTAELQVQVGTGAHPVISWTPATAMYGLIIRQEGITLGNLRWSLAASGLDGFGSPVTYGILPPSTTQIWPLNGQAQALTPGVSYQLALVAAAGDTARITFTP